MTFKKNILVFHSLAIAQHTSTSSQTRFTFHCPFHIEFKPTLSNWLPFLSHIFLLKTPPPFENSPKELPPQILLSPSRKILTSLNLFFFLKGSVTQSIKRLVNSSYSLNPFYWRLQDLVTLRHHSLPIQHCFNQSRKTPIYTLIP